jgi:hypothetical protein
MAALPHGERRLAAILHLVLSAPSNALMRIAGTPPSLSMKMSNRTAKFLRY